jgi:inorganic pyrophosphatase
LNISEYLNKKIKVTIDRKMGSKHPKHGFIYPINYGYVPNTISGDGEELDCYVLGVFEPLDEFEGNCIAIIHRLNDNDDKLIIVPDNKNFSNSEIEVLTEFQERFFEHEIIRSEVIFNSLIPELSVSNIEASKKFYENIGFKIIYERPENKFCFMQLENNQIMLEESNENWNVGKLEYPYGNGINISMSIKDIEKKYNELKNINIKFFLDLEIHEYRVDNKIFKDSEFLLQDPDGYLLRFNN